MPSVKKAARNKGGRTEEAIKKKGAKEGEGTVDASERREREPAVKGGGVIAGDLSVGGRPLAVEKLYSFLL